MRRSYYDQDGLNREQEPYGAVPPQSGLGAVPRIAAKPLRQEAPEEPEKRTTPLLRKRGGGVAGFLILLFLILALAVTGILVNGGLPELELPFAWAGDIWEGSLPGGWDYYYYEEEDWDDWVAGLEQTTLERADAGGGAQLLLSPVGEEQLTPQEVYARVSPSVVGIRVSIPGRGMGVATGIVMTDDGYILTNAHVVSGVDRASVILSDDGRQAEARLVGYDVSTDLAVLKIDAQGLTPAEFGDSSLLRVGDSVYAIGNPLGEELWGTMTDGIISAIDRRVDASNGTMTLLQTTAAINNGSSGGALANAAGQVVGITNMKMMSDWETIEGLGFAIPTSLAKKVVDQIIATGSYAGEPSIGVTVRTQPAVAETPAGAYVIEVEEGSDAYTKGIRPGDLITAANGAAVQTVQDLLEAKEGLEVGESLTFTVWRDGRERKVSVRLVGKNEM